MQLATINGVTLRYEVLGDRGPWMALSPGGRREMGNARPLAQKMAAAGYRVLIHDRRNCGASEVAFDASQSEYEIWADDLAALLQKLNATPTIVGGGSSGCRLAILYALKYPSRVKALLIWRVTGGAFAAERLSENYYGQYIRMAETGGMAAVAASEHFAQRIIDNPRNRQLLDKISAEEFVDVMEAWRTYFTAGANLPVIGATEAELNSIKVPVCIIPGNDKTHSHVTGEAARRMLPNNELHDLWPGDLDIDLFPAEDWAQKEEQQAAIFADFLKRRGLTA